MADTDVKSSNLVDTRTGTSASLYRKTFAKNRAIEAKELTDLYPVVIKILVTPVLKLFNPCRSTRRSGYDEDEYPQALCSVRSQVWRPAYWPTEEKACRCSHNPANITGVTSIRGPIDGVRLFRF